MNETIIAIGNGGYNLATDLIGAGLFPDSRLIVCDTNERDLEKHSANATETILLEKIRSKVKSDIKSAMKDRTLVELANDPKNDALQEYIPEEYRVKDLPLVWLRSDTYPEITDEDRKGIFNLY